MTVERDALRKMAESVRSRLRQQFSARVLAQMVLDYLDAQSEGDGSWSLGCRKGRHAGCRGEFRHMHHGVEMSCDCPCHLPADPHEDTARLDLTRLIEFKTDEQKWRASLYSVESGCPWLLEKYVDASGNREFARWLHSGWHLTLRDAMDAARQVQERESDGD